MMEGVAGWKKRGAEMFMLFCERIFWEDGSKALSERAALLPACVHSGEERGADVVLPSPCFQLSVYPAQASFSLGTGKSC